MRSGTSTSVDADTGLLLERAASLAWKEHPHPNPRVGCVIRGESGAIVGEGAHVAVGRDHAEIVALGAAGLGAAGGTLVVTLEPCIHHGLTPPCVDQIIEAGVKTVVIGCIDPDPRVAGAGVAALQARGIEVVVLEAAAEWVDPGYFHHRRTGYPFVTLKLATTLDGQVAAADHSSQWITSTEARRDAHVLRSRSDAVMVGAGTVLRDDPRLDVRLDGYTGQQPIPVVIAGERALPATAAVLSRDPIVYGGGAGARSAGGLASRNAEAAGVDVDAVLADLGGRAIVDVLVEGGPRLARSLIDAGLVQRIVWYIGSKLAAGTGHSAIAGAFATLGDAIDLEISEVVQIGPDVKIIAHISGAG